MLYKKELVFPEISPKKEKKRKLAKNDKYVYIKSTYDPYDHNFPIWLFKYPWVENTDSCHVLTLIPLRLLSNVKCLSITLAPFATAPKVGMKPSSWPEYPIWISGKFLWYSSSTFKCTSFESILRESSWYYFIQNNEWQSLFGISKKLCNRIGNPNFKRMCWAGTNKYVIKIILGRCHHPCVSSCWCFLGDLLQGGSGTKIELRHHT